MEAEQFLVFSPLKTALSNPGFLFSECAHMFFIETQPRFIRGVVLPWVISLLKKSLIMPLRKFYLKIHAGLCCSRTPPWTAGRGSVGLPQLLRAHGCPFPPRRPGSEGVPGGDPHLPWLGRVSGAPMTSARTREAVDSGLPSVFIEGGRVALAGSCTPKT